jgi:hypothetical protein
LSFGDSLDSIQNNHISHKGDPKQGYEQNPKYDTHFSRPKEPKEPEDKQTDQDNQEKRVHFELIEEEEDDKEELEERDILAGLIILMPLHRNPIEKAEILLIQKGGQKEQKYELFTTPYMNPKFNPINILYRDIQQKFMPQNSISELTLQSRGELTFENSENDRFTRVYVETISFKWSTHHGVFVKLNDFWELQNVSPLIRELQKQKTQILELLST